MPYFLQLCTADGTKLLMPDDPYDSYAAALADAEAGAKQIVADALKGGASLLDAIRHRSFDIVDDAGNLLTSLPFYEALNSNAKP